MKSLAHLLNSDPDSGNEATFLINYTKMGLRLFITRAVLGEL